MGTNKGTFWHWVDCWTVETDLIFQVKYWDGNVRYEFQIFEQAAVSQTPLV